MSSTNRGYDRHTADYYVTPKQPINDFLSIFLSIEDIATIKIQKDCNTILYIGK